MTDPRAVAIEVVTEALDAVDFSYWEDCIYHSPGDTALLAETMLASPRFASLLETGAAVEQAEAMWHYVAQYDRRIGYTVTLPPAFYRQPERLGVGPTLAAAISAALEPQP